MLEPLTAKAAQPSVQLASDNNTAPNTQILAQALPQGANDRLPAPSVAQLESKSSPDVNPMAQVTSVSQLSDVKPTDWAFQALQSLVERYGCIVGYPDKNIGEIVP